MRGIAVALLIFVSAASARTADIDTLTVEAPALEPLGEFSGLVSALSLVLIPKVFADGVLLKTFVSSEEFAGARKQWGDRHAVDVLFRRAQNLCWGNSFCALLISFLAVVDHQRVGVRTPVPGLILWFPLTGEFSEEYTLRVAGLPTRVAADSPETGGGDRDKLQHFFGSALLAYLSESGDQADRFGEFVEEGEERFIVGGVMDERDLEADRRGRDFGLRLLGGPEVRPSAFLNVPLRQPPGSPGFHVGQERSP